MKQCFYQYEGEGEHVLTQVVNRGQWQLIWTYRVQSRFYWDIALTVETPPPPFPEEERGDMQHLTNMSTQTAVKITHFAHRVQ